jgi:hypothetical protein
MSLFHYFAPRRSVILSLFAIALAAFAMLGESNVANAGPISIIEASGSGTSGSWTTLGSGTAAASDLGISGSATTLNGVAIGISTLASNYSGTTVANTSQATLQITNNATSTQTVYLSFGVNGFTSPQSPVASLALWSSVSGTVTAVGSNASANTILITGYVNQVQAPGDSTNYGTAGSTGLSGTSATPGLYTVAGNGPGGLGSYDSPTGVTLFSPLVGDFALNQEIVVTLSAGAQISIQGSLQLIPTPEPGTLTLIGIGVISMAGYGWRRRRQQQAAVDTVA